MNSKKNLAFTLVELLVVISIIALLVAIVLPAINSALFRGKLTATAANGRSLQQSIFARVTEDVYVTAQAPWPVHKDTDADQGYLYAEDYLYSMVSNGTLNVSYNFFTAPGIRSAKDKKDFVDTGGYNAWCITGDISESSTETLPLVFTQNLKIEELKSDVYTDNKLSDKLLDVVPFERKGFVFVTKGGSAYSLFKDQLKCGSAENPGQFRMLFDVRDPSRDPSLSEPPDAENKILRPKKEPTPRGGTT